LVKAHQNNPEAHLYKKQDSFYKTMTMKQLLFLLSLVTLFIACNSDASNDDDLVAVDINDFLEKIKYHPGDPFIETFKESEFFKLSGLEDHVIETANGTILSIPKGAFRDKDGRIVEKEVTIEVTDIANLEEQIQSNISGQHKDKVLKTGATLFINATADGQQLGFNKKNPVYVATKLQTELKDALIFEGIRNPEGEMQWLAPAKPKQYLIPVDLKELDFLPPTFATTAQKHLPFRNYKVATKKLLDSLYYSFGAEYPRKNSDNKNVSPSPSSYKFYQDGGYPQADDTSSCTGIDPNSIKVIKKEPFAQSLIATKAFQERMHYLHFTREQAALDIYIQHLDWDMTRCDEKVAQLLGKNSAHQLQFKAFARENLGNLKDIPPSVKNLGNYYSKQLKKTRKKLVKLKEALDKALKTKAESAEEKRADYKKVLYKRAEYRLDKFGFKLDKMGWMNIAEALAPLDKFDLEIRVKDGQKYDRVHVYTVDKRISSIFAFKSSDKKLFREGYNGDPYLLYLEMQQAEAVVVAYKGTETFYDKANFQVTPVIRVGLNPQAITQKALNARLKKMESGYKSFNKIKLDLEYQAAFYAEELRMKQLRNDLAFVSRLRPIALPCGSAWPTN
jgi:hypothetical protein